MLDSQTIVRLYQPLVVNYGNFTSSYRTIYALEGAFATAQTLLLILPSAIFLVLFLIRGYTLKGESLKVLPNYTGAIKAVRCVAILFYIV